MDVLEAIKNRRSIRRFTSEQVSIDDIEKILEAGRLAPSGSNLQGWRFIVAKDPRIINMIRIFSPGFLGTAPLAIVVCSDIKMYEAEGNIVGRDYVRIADCAMAVENMLLVAHALGLGACPVRSFSTIALREILEIPKEIEPELIIMIGHPINQPKPPPKLQLQEITYLDCYGKKWRGRGE